jgi:3-deoxy-D-arabino-heptulosonate 7-phosphate (DAHP) synthase class II
MKRIAVASVIKDADRVHELQQTRRDLIAQLRTVQAEIEPLRAKLRKASKGEDFVFDSADGFQKIVEFNEEDGKPDVNKMTAMLLSLRRKIPMIPVVAVVVRYLTDDEMD